MVCGGSRLTRTAYRVECPDCGLRATFEQPAIDNPFLTFDERGRLEEEVRQEIRELALKFRIAHGNRSFAIHGHRCHPNLYASNAEFNDRLTQQQLAVVGA